MIQYAIYLIIVGKEKWEDFVWSWDEVQIYEQMIFGNYGIFYFY